MDLNLFNTFVAVIESGSMTQAAKRLRQPVSRVSRAVARLERDLKLDLILRTTRAFQITEAGRNLFREVQPMIKQMNELERNIGSESEALSGLVRITGPEDFGQALAPIIEQLSKTHPALDFDVNLTDEFVDLVKTETDIGIRAGKLRDSTLKAKYLGKSTFVFVASPDYLDKFGIPKKPQDLLDHRLIHAFSRANQRNEWLLTNGQRTEKVKFTSGWKINHKALAVSLARSGVGITLVPKTLVLEAITQKELVQILPQWGLDPSPVHLVYPPHRITSKKVREVSSFLELKLKELFV